MPNSTVALYAVFQKQEDDVFRQPFDGKYFENAKTEAS
jgi:hypothetical protein